MGLPAPESAGKSVHFHVTLVIAALYVLSGVSQPLLMTVAKEAGLADPTCQLYMLFYYMGPASVILTVINDRSENSTPWRILVKIGFVAMIDIVAQTMNYTGSTMAGPTIFAIIYSSVTVWTAVMSRFFLGRSMDRFQWLGVILVFGGLTITAFGSVSMGPQIYHGALLVIVGSALHALMYVLSEQIMNAPNCNMSARKYCGVYASAAFFGYFLWQVFYTRQHLEKLVLEPMKVANTTIASAAAIFSAIGIVSLVHSVTFFHTVKFFPGGATSAGIMKALQAVLVFVATAVVFCGYLGGKEMCFSVGKFISLVVVVGGLLLYGNATEKKRRQVGYMRVDSLPSIAEQRATDLKKTQVVEMI